jgi:SAM-dependent methyltransferase
VSDFAAGSLDYVFSSHCLEHIEDWRPALAEWVRKVRPGGVVFLYLPHPACAIWHPGSPFVGDDHKWSPAPDVIKQALEGLGCEAEACDDGPDAMQSFYVCARRRG